MAMAAGVARDGPTSQRDAGGRVEVRDPTPQRSTPSCIGAAIMEARDHRQTTRMRRRKGQGTMRAWVVRELGVATFEHDVEPPTLDDSDEHGVLVNVEAAATNFADSLMIRGAYQEKPEPPFVPGLEVAGTVAASKHPAWRPGDRVVGLTRPGRGSWSELAQCDARQLVELPDDIEKNAALGLHINAQTAWFCLHRGARVAPGETVLIHAAAGGVGSMTVQLAVEAGANVIATSSAAKREVVERLGPQHWLDNRSPDWPDAVREIAPNGVDVVVDTVGGSIFDQSWKLLAFEGRMVAAGFTSKDLPVVKANHAMVKNVSLIGIYWSRYTLEATALTREAASQIWDLHRRGRLDPLVTVRDSIPNALDRNGDLAGGRTTGKVVLTW